MPGGLQEVVQPVGADTSRYKAEWLSVLPVLNQVSAAQKEIIGQAGDIAKAMQAMHGAGAGAAAASDIGKMNAAIRDQLAALREAQPAIAAAQKATGDYAQVVQYLGSTHADLAPQIRATTAAIGDHAASLQQLTRVQEAATGAVADHAVVLEQAADAHGSGAETVLAYATSLGLLESKARSATSALSDIAAAATAFSGTGGGGGGGGAMDAATAAIIARNLTRQGLGPNPASSTGDQAAIAAAMSALGGGGGAGGAGGGGAGGGAGGFVPWAGGGWQAVRFWGMMGAEIASTVVPAVVAAGSAALVGAQGFEQLAGRAQAVYAVSEALGTSLNKTAGQFFGGGDALQNAQNAAGGGVYGLAGAGINILKSGAGGAFLQQGTNTLAMLDRAAAGAVLNITQGGTGQKLASALGGGTGYLQQFGEIGANLGTSLLNFAPDLPGVGSDLLSTLTGASGGLRALSGLPSPLLKSFFTYEAASRWGPALLGGQGLIGRMLGLGGVGGLGGLLGKGGEALFARGMGGTLGDVGLGMMGAGDALAALSGPEIGLPLAAFQLGSSALNRYVPQGAAGTATANIAKWQTQVANAGFAGAWQPLGHGLQMATAGAAAAPVVPGAGTPIGPDGRPLPAGRVGVGIEAAVARSPKQQYEQAAQGFAQQMGELVNAGPQLAGALKQAGIKGLSMGDAFQAASNALLDIPHSFGPNGKVNPQALQQLKDYAATIGPMTQSGGAFGAAVAGTEVMQSGQMKNLATVNQSMDAMTAIMTGGPSAMSGLAQMLGGTPTSVTRGGLKLQPTPAIQEMAKALASFTTPQGAAAWQTFAGSNGLIAGMQSNLDQARTGMTLNALTPGQAAGITGFQLQQLLPLAKNNPAALAMLMQQGAQAGIGGNLPGGGYYDSSLSPQQNYQNYQKALAGTAYTSKQANTAEQQQAIKESQLPTTAAEFAQGIAPALQAQRLAAAATDAMAIQKSSLKGGINQGAVSDLLNQIKSSGATSPAALKAGLDATLKQAGVSQTMRVKIEADTSGLKIPAVNIPSKVEPPKVPAVPKPPPVDYTTRVKPPQVPPAPKPPTVDYPSKVEKPAPPPAPKGATVSYPSLVTKPVAPPAPKGGVVVYTSVVIPPTAANNPYAGGISGRAGMASGGLVPGTGSGDIVPAMLTPGEVVIPKSLVSQLAPFLAAHGVPGFGSPAGTGTHFAAGGLVSGGTSLAQVTAQINTVWQTLDALYAAEKSASGAALAQLKSQVNSVYSTKLDPLYAQQAALKKGASSSASSSSSGSSSGPQGFGLNFGGSTTLQQAYAQGLAASEAAAAKKAGGDFVVSVSGEIAKAMDTTAGGQKIASTLISQIGTALNYAKGISSTTQSGLNLAQMTAGTPATSGVGAAAPGTPGYNPAAWNAAVANATDGAAAPAPTVQQQMQSYLSSTKSFTGDLKSLSSQGLNKGILSQLIGAGPVQGDSLAQSILGGAGGVKAVNSLQSQITKASNALGAQAGMSMYPGVKIAPNLQSASASEQVPGVGGKTATVTVKASGVEAVQSAINSIQGKTVTINVQALGAGIASKGMQTGGLVPGSGFGDIIPAMLEPGEAVIPRGMVPMLSPLLRQLGVPGFQGSMDWAQFNKAMGLGNAGSGGAGGGGSGGGASGGTLDPYHGAPPAGMSWLQWIFQGTQFKQPNGPGGYSPALGGGTGHSLAVNVSVGDGTLNLTRAHISDIAAQVQAELLRQARTNPGTGLQLSGRGT